MNYDGIGVYYGVIVLVSISLILFSKLTFSCSTFCTLSFNVSSLIVFYFNPFWSSANFTSCPAILLSYSPILSPIDPWLLTWLFAIANFILSSSIDLSCLAFYLISSYYFLLNSFSLNFRYSSLFWIIALKSSIWNVNPL